MNTQPHLTMNLYTVIVYVLPAGSHHVESLEAGDATEAVIRLRERLLLAKEECELVAVACGRVQLSAWTRRRLRWHPIAVR